MRHIVHSIFTGCLALILAVCLGPASASASPSVFPTGTTIHDEAKAYQGYTIYQARGDGAVDVPLVNMAGEVVHRFTNSSFNNGGYSAEPLANGNILTLVYPAGDDAAERGFAEFDWTGAAVFSWFDPDGAEVHHDVEAQSDGTYLVLLRSRISKPEIWAGGTLLDDFIYQVDRTGKVIWEWHGWEHYAEFGFKDSYEAIMEATSGDWLHINSIQTLPANAHTDPNFREGNILVSARTCNTIFIIDKTTGSVVWKIGPYDNLTIGQHDPQMIAQGLDGAGEILVYDNGGNTYTTPEFRGNSRAVQINPGPKEITWKYQAAYGGLGNNNTFFSPTQSGVQRLPNGNTMIVEAQQGRIFEVTSDYENVWEFMIPENMYSAGGGYYNKMLYRAYRVAPDWAPVQ